MNNCEETREIIENLSPSSMKKTEQKEFRDHIKKCQKCRELYEQMLSLNRLLDLWEAPAPKGNIQARVMARVAQIEREGGHRGFLLQLKNLFHYRLRIPAIALLALLLILFTSLGINLALFLIGSPGSTKETRVAAIPPIQPTPVIHVVDPTADRNITVKDTLIYRESVDVSDPLDVAVKSGATQPAMIMILGVPPILQKHLPFSKNQNRVKENRKGKENSL